MEGTKEVEGPNPSSPQSHPLPGSQQLKGGLRGSQGSWMRSRSLYSKPGLSLSTGAINDGTRGLTSQAHIPRPIHQLSQDPAQVGFLRCNYAQASQDAPRLYSANPSLSPIVGVQQHLPMDDGTLTPPMGMHSNSTSEEAQNPLGLSWHQVQVGRESEVPAKVMVGWGKGPYNNNQMAPVGPRKSRWPPYFLSGQNGTVEGQDPPLVLAQTPVQDQERGKCPGQAPTPGPTTTLPSMSPPPPSRATPPALNAAPTSAVAEPYTCSPDCLTDTTLGTKGLSQDVLARSCGNLPPTLLEPSKMVPSCQDKVNFPPRKEPLTPAPAPEEFPACVQEHEVARRQVSPEDSAKKYLIYNSKPGIPIPVPEPPDTPKTQRSSQKNCSSQPDKQPLNAHNNNNCPNVPPCACVTCHKQPPLHSPREDMQIPFSSAPTCQLQDAVEDHVVVFDMTTGNSRVGVLCHDPMGSRTVLVGLTPNNPASLVPNSTPSAIPLPRPVLSPNSNHSIFWSTAAMPSSPVPSSLSVGSYQEVALDSKEAKHNLALQNSAGTVPPWMPVQLDEKIVTHVPDPSWSKPDEPSRTIWMLESSVIPDASVVQPKQLQWIKTDPAPAANVQVVQEQVGSHNQKEVMTAHSDHPQAEDSEQVFLTGQTFLNGPSLLARQLSVDEQGSLSSQPPPTKQLSLSSLPPVTGQTPLCRQPFLTRQVPPAMKSPITNEPTLSRGPLTSGEPGQASTQQSEPLSLPTHVGILLVPLAPMEACTSVNRDDKVGTNTAQSSDTHWLPSWQPGSNHRAHEEQRSPITFTSRKELPVIMVGTEPQSGRLFKLTAEDITRSPVVAQLGLLRGHSYELASPADALPVQLPVICRHASGPYQNMAALVIDTGTGFTKCGLAGEDPVLSVVPSQVQMIQRSAQGQPQYVVPEQQGGSYSVLNRGVVSDWDALEVLWQHLFYCRLRVQPEELTVLVADSPVSPHANREKVAEILFERFRVPAMQTVHQALLTLYAYGRTTGLVVGSGYGTSYVAPILPGDLAPLDTYRLDVAGVDLTNYLAQLLRKGGQSPPKEGLINQIKESCCYVALDVASEMARNQSLERVDVVLPDEQVITLGSERFCCSEALFQPNLLGLNQPGLPQLALLSISQLEARQRDQLLANVVLEGGSTLVTGFPERLRQELGPGASVLGSPHRAVAAWLGGSILARRDSFQSLWLSRRQYEEEGPWAIYKHQL